MAGTSDDRIAGIHQSLKGEELKAAVKAAFAANPEATKLYVCRDGECFYEEHSAVQHERYMANRHKGVVLVERDQADTDEAYRYFNENPSDVAEGAGQRGRAASAPGAKKAAGKDADARKGKGDAAAQNTATGGEGSKDAVGGGDAAAASKDADPGAGGSGEGGAPNPNA